MDIATASDEELRAYFAEQARANLPGLAKAHARAVQRERRAADELRRAAVHAARHGGLSEVEAARLAGVSRTTLRKWRNA